MLAGDFNSKIGDMLQEASAQCSCHQAARATLHGETCDRGRELYEFSAEHGLHILNGCRNNAEQATYRELNEDGSIRYQSTLDYILVNDAALGMVADFQTVFQPRRASNRKFHAHLVLTLRWAPQSSPAHSYTEYNGPRYRWRHSSENRWNHFTSSETFQEDFASVVTAHYNSPEELHDAVKSYLCQAALAAEYVDVISVKRHCNPNKIGKLKQPWFDVTVSDAKRDWEKVRRAHGRQSMEAHSAHRNYLRAINVARNTFWETLPY